MIAPLILLLALGQSFEVASIRPTNPDERSLSFNFTPGEGLSIKGGTLKGIIETAYDVRAFQIIGGPAWLSTQRYNITAKTAADETIPTDSKLAVAETRRRLQALLADRFQLKVHRETKELPEYALVTGKTGSKLVAIENPHGGGASFNCGIITGTSASMTVLALVLSRQLGRPVIDRTGLAGRYDFKIAFAPDPGTCGQQEEVPSQEGPSLFTAIQEQLGLKLEAIKGPVEIIVVDNAMKADEN